MLKILVCIVLFQSLEIYGLIYIHDWVEAFYGSSHALLLTVASIFLTGFWGLKVAKYQGLNVLRELTQKIQASQPPTEKLMEAVLILLGGIFLLVPGYISDFWGVCLLSPMIRRRVFQVSSGVFYDFFSKNIFNMTKKSSNSFSHFYYKTHSSNSSANQTKKEDKIIDVEIDDKGQ